MDKQIPEAVMRAVAEWEQCMSPLAAQAAMFKIANDLRANEAERALAAAQQQGHAADFVDIANRAQIATGRGVMPSTVEAVLRAAGVVQPMQQGGGAAIEDDYLSRLDWLFKQRGHSNDDPIYSMFSAFVPNLQSLTAPLSRREETSCPVGVEEVKQRAGEVLAALTPIGINESFANFAFRAIEAALAQQPAADPLVEWANSPLNFTATVGVFKDGVQPAAVDEACAHCVDGTVPMTFDRPCTHCHGTGIATQHQEPTTGQGDDRG